MKNKKLIYLLLPLAFAIWGIIGYKIWSSLSADTGVAGDTISPVLPIRAAEASAERLPTLLLRYPDPFISQRVPTASPTANASAGALFAAPQQAGSGAVRAIATLPASPPPAASPPVTPVVSWPSLEYRGLIENRQKGTRVAMLTISGVDYLLQEKQSQQGVTLARIYADSVLLSFQQQRQVIKRGK